MTDTTETGSGAQEGDAGDGAEPEPAGGEPPYDPLKHYDPEREFEMIVEARTEIDDALLEHTRPFAKDVVRLIRLSAWAVVWAAGVVPALEALNWLGYTPSLGWHIAILLSVPICVLIFVLFKRFIQMQFKLRWVEVYLKMYLDDDISNLLYRERDAAQGTLTSTQIGSNTALLNLLRLRMRAFHFWHRISIHSFLLNGMFFRPALDTPFRSPRLLAYGVPILTLTIFLSVQWAFFVGGNGVQESAVDMAEGYAGQLWSALSMLHLSGKQNSAYTAPFMAAGLAAAFLAYWLSRRSREQIVSKLNKFLDTSDFLTPFTHDSSRAILAKHEWLLRSLARAMSWRGGAGGQGGHGLGDLMLNEERDDRK